MECVARARSAASGFACPAAPTGSAGAGDAFLSASRAQGIQFSVTAAAEANRTPNQGQSRAEGRQAKGHSVEAAQEEHEVSGAELSCSKAVLSSSPSVSYSDRILLPDAPDAVLVHHPEH